MLRNQYITNIRFTGLGFFDSLWEYRNSDKTADFAIVRSSKS